MEFLYNKESSQKLKLKSSISLISLKAWIIDNYMVPIKQMQNNLKSMDAWFGSLNARGYRKTMWWLPPMQYNIVLYAMATLWWVNAQTREEQFAVGMSMFVFLQKEYHKSSQSAVLCLTFGKPLFNKQKLSLPLPQA